MHRSKTSGTELIAEVSHDRHRHVPCVDAELNGNAPDQDVQALNLPEVPIMMDRIARDGRNLYAKQTYEAFAVDVERRNSCVALDQDLVNRAFKYAAKEVPGLERRESGRMLNRVRLKS